MSVKKAYDELCFTDDFLFWKILTSDTELCREMLELLLDLKIREVRLAQGQKAVDLTYDGRGVRFDVYVEDADNSVYDIEMQVKVEKQIPKRLRYYQGMIDLNLLSSGKLYSELRKTYIIFICLEDPFGLNLPIYHFRNMCQESPTLALADEAEKVVINAAGKREGLSPRVASFLDYIQGKAANSEFTNKLDVAVRDAREHKEWRLDYMSLLEKLRDEYDEGWAECSREKQKEIDAANRKADAANRLVDAANRKVDAANKKADAANRKIDAANAEIARLREILRNYQGKPAQS